jgi:pyridoxine kinase
MKDYGDHWQALGVSFRGILSGYLGTPEAAAQTEAFLDRFHRPGVCYLCDPVLGDNGHIYRGFTKSMIDAVKKLSRQADLLTPNLTEFCILTGTDLDPLLALEKDNPSELFRQLYQKSAVLQHADLVITGIPFSGEQGKPMIANLVIQHDTCVPVCFPHLGGSYSGTGDLFAAVLLAGRLQEQTLVQSVRLAGTFISRGIQDARKEQVPRNDGINYEPYLRLLTQERKDPS